MVDVPTGAVPTGEWPPYDGASAGGAPCEGANWPKSPAVCKACGPAWPASISFFGGRLAPGISL
ncbi:MAG: hypothetical protein QM775_32725 [Pirellulales bacterium]